jgi:murein DD-endopeptidase MepM/ murein hydrolase activator NlpD
MMSTRMRSATRCAAAAITMGLALALAPAVPAEGQVRIPTAGRWHRHSGYPWAVAAWDITIPGSADCGNRVRAARGGRVIAARKWRRSYGIHVITFTPLGRLRYYAHLRRESVRVGEYVHRGEVIGRIGSTGNSTGCHLHYEIR